MVLRLVLRSGKCSHRCFSVCSQLTTNRPTEEELKAMDSWPCKEFRSGWESYFKDKPDKPVMHYSVISGWFGDHMLMPHGKFFTMFHFLEYPFSRGFTHINSPVSRCHRSTVIHTLTLIYCRTPMRLLTSMRVS